MYCPQCGTANSEPVRECLQCGSLIARSAPIQAPAIEDSAGMRMLLPIGRSWWAMAAGYLGLVSILMLPAPFALLCGILGIIDIKKNPQKHGMGRCLLGVIAGGIMTGFLGLLMMSIVLSE